MSFGDLIGKKRERKMRRWVNENFRDLGSGNGKEMESCGDPSYRRERREREKRDRERH